MKKLSRARAEAIERTHKEWYGQEVVACMFHPWFGEQPGLPGIDPDPAQDLPDAIDVTTDLDGNIRISSFNWHKPGCCVLSIEQARHLADLLNTAAGRLILQKIKEG